MEEFRILVDSRLTDLADLLLLDPPHERSVKIVKITEAMGCGIYPVAYEIGFLRGVLLSILGECACDWARICDLNEVFHSPINMTVQQILGKIEGARYRSELAVRLHELVYCLREFVSNSCHG